MIRYAEILSLLIILRLLHGWRLLFFPISLKRKEDGLDATHGDGPHSSLAVKKPERIAGTNEKSWISTLNLSRIDR